jgi:hypothetical protein
MNTRAYVSGDRIIGYVLHVPNGLPPMTSAEFSRFDGMEFTRFRAAQLLANAINEDARVMARRVR